MSGDLGPGLTGGQHSLRGSSYLLEVVTPGEILLREKRQSFGLWIVGRHCLSVFGWVKCSNGPSPPGVPTLEPLYGGGVVKQVPQRA